MVRAMPLKFSYQVYLLVTFVDLVTASEIPTEVCGEGVGGATSMLSVRQQIDTSGPIDEIHRATEVELEHVNDSSTGSLNHEKFGAVGKQFAKPYRTESYSTEEAGSMLQDEIDAQKRSASLTQLDEVYANGGRSEQECVPLHACNGLLALWRNRHSVLLNPDQVSQVLRRAECGTRGDQLLVYCNEDVKEESDFAKARGGTDMFDIASKSCDGHLTMYSIQYDYANVQTLRLTDVAYPNIRRLQNRVVFEIENGNCCWKKYAQEDFVGVSEKFSKGYIGSPRDQPKSVEKIDCV